MLLRFFEPIGINFLLFFLKLGSSWRIRCAKLVPEWNLAFGGLHLGVVEVEAERRVDCLCDRFVAQGDFVIDTEQNTTGHAFSRA